MAWVLSFHPAVRKDLKHLPQEARNSLLKTDLPGLAQNPFLGYQLHGPLKEFWKFRAGEYRIAYAVHREIHEIVVLQIGPRGGFYERLRHRISL